MTGNCFQTGHIGINVTKLDRSQKFYQDVFELELIGSTEDNRKPGKFV